MSFETRTLIDALNSVVAPPAVLHEPWFCGNEAAYVKDCIDTGWVSTAGSYVTRFENDLAAFTGAKHAIATSNGTAALHAILVAMNIGAGDEVIAPAFTFVATGNAIAYSGARPHFVDIEPDGFGLDAAKLEQHLAHVAEPRNGHVINKQTGRRIAAIMCMHTFGHPSDVHGLIKVANSYGIPFLEDAAESIGSKVGDQHTGTFGQAAALSFNGNKIITTGGGGAVLTNDDDLAKRIRHLTTTAKEPHAFEYIHDEVGFNYRLVNLNAALGCAQIEMLPTFLSHKRTLADRYIKSFADVSGVAFAREPDRGHSNYWLNAILLTDENGTLSDKEVTTRRNQVLQDMIDAGFGVRAAWRPMHLLPMFADDPKADLTVTENIYARLINIPSSAQLGAEATVG